MKGVGGDVEDRRKATHRDVLETGTDAVGSGEAHDEEEDVSIMMSLEDDDEGWTVDKTGGRGGDGDEERIEVEIEG